MSVKVENTPGPTRRIGMSGRDGFMYFKKNESFQDLIKIITNSFATNFKIF